MSRLIVLLLSVIPACVFSTPSEKNNQTNANSRNISEQQIQTINQHIDEAELKGLSGYVLVIVESKVIISRGIGKQSFELNQDNKADTIFDIGSNTKQFTATAIMKLAEEGLLSVNQPLSDFFESIPPEKSKITIHHLLTHSAGFKESLGRDFETLTKKDFLQNSLNTPLEFNPGERYQYSNIGYSMLAAIIEEVSGLSYEAYVNKKLFKPVGMTQTGYLLPQWNMDKVAKGYHRGYRNIGTIVERYQGNGVSWNLVGNGGIQSSANDLNKWFIALQSGQILSKSTIDTILTKYVQYPDIDWYYGYGWGNGLTKQGELLAGHNGSNGVFWSTLYWMPDRELFISFSSNAEMESITGVAREIRRIASDPAYIPQKIDHNVYWEVANFTTTHEKVDIKALDKYLNNLPLIINDGNVLNRIGWWLIDQNKKQWAMALFEKNVSLFPEDGNLYDSLGEGYLSLGDIQKAKASFEQALRIAPSNDCHWCDNSKTQLSKLTDINGTIGGKLEGKK